MGQTVGYRDQETLPIGDGKEIAIGFVCAVNEKGSWI